MNCPSQGRRRSNWHWTSRGVPVLSRVLPVLFKYCAVAITFPNVLDPCKDPYSKPTYILSPLFLQNFRRTPRPSPMKVALGISVASRCWFVYYTYYLSTSPSPSIQGRRWLNSYWTFPSRPGVGSCTTHYLKASNTMTNDTAQFSTYGAPPQFSIISGGRL